MKCCSFKGLAWETDVPAPIDAKGQFYELGNSWAHDVRASNEATARAALTATRGLTQHTRVNLMRNAALFLFLLSAAINTVMVVLGLFLIAIWGTTP